MRLSKICEIVFLRKCKAIKNVNKIYIIEKLQPIMLKMSTYFHIQTTKFNGAGLPEPVDETTHVKIS